LLAGALEDGDEQQEGVEPRLCARQLQRTQQRRNKHVQTARTKSSNQEETEKKEANEARKGE
jgi:hypothetical protein